MPFPITGSSSVSTLTTETITQTAHGFVVGDWVYLSGASTYAKTDASATISSDSVGIVSAVADVNTFSLSTDGYVSGLTGLTAGSRYYISDIVGEITTTAPTNAKAVFIADTTTSGWVQQYSLVAGQTVDYVSVNRITSNQSIALDSDVIYNSISSGNIPYNTITGVFTLTAEKTYNLSATSKIRNDGTGDTGRYVQFEWVDASTNTALPGLRQGVSIMAASVLNESATDSTGGIYTPSTNQTIKVRVTGTGGSNLELDSNRTSAVITQLGSSAAITNPNPLPVVQTFNSSGTYTPTSGMKYAIVKMIGGGGGGGGAPASGASNVGLGRNGGNGGYIEAMLTAAQIGASRLVTIGAGGLGSTGVGGSGGTTSLGSLLSASGGGQGEQAGSNASIQSAQGANGGAFNISTGTNIASRIGDRGGVSYVVLVANGNRAFIRHNSGTPFGPNISDAIGPNFSSTPGINASANSGVGGTGGTSTPGGPATSGGNGGSGKMVITEYF